MRFHRLGRFTLIKKRKQMPFPIKKREYIIYSSFEFFFFVQYVSIFKIKIQFTDNRIHTYRVLDQFICLNILQGFFFTITRFQN